MEQPAARLEVVSGKGAGMSVLVTDELLIGRNAEGAGRLAEDDEISRTHARVTVDGTGRCVIEDLGSTNGTFVNGQRISEAQQLAVGDKLELGATMLLVKDLPAPPVSPTIEREIPPEAAPPSGIKVEPTVINAPIVTPPPPAQETPAQSDATPAEPTAAPPPAEPAAPTVEPTAVPPPTEPVAPTVEPTIVPPSPEPDIPEPAPSPVPPPMSVQLEVDFAAGEVRITPGNLQTVRFVFKDGSWRPATG